MFSSHPEVTLADVATITDLFLEALNANAGPVQNLLQKRIGTEPPSEMLDCKKVPNGRDVPCYHDETVKTMTTGKKKHLTFPSR